MLVDFGDGDVLDQLDELGSTASPTCCVTHHHRDQVAGPAPGSGRRQRASGCRRSSGS